MEDVRYVSEDRDEEGIEELENVGTKLLELEITGIFVSYCSHISPRL